MTQYLIKYMTKNDKHRRMIKGRLWGCSRNLSQAKNIFITAEEKEAFEMFSEIKTFPQDYKIYDWLQVKYFSPIYFEQMEPCELLKLYNGRIQTIRKGYAPTKNFFFDENGNPMSYENAVKQQLPPIQQALHEEQLLIFHEN